MNYLSKDTQLTLTNKVVGMIIMISQAVHLPPKLFAFTKFRGGRLVPDVSVSVQINYCPLLRDKVKL
jgi:hypothetical protein